jgi:DNA-binding transcriptional ArsR family regulator
LPSSAVGSRVEHRVEQGGQHARDAGVDVEQALVFHHADELAEAFVQLLYPGTNRLLQISQEELGYLAGVSRQRANQGLKVLEDAGLVRSEYGGINVLDLDGLRTFGD